VTSPPRLRGRGEPGRRQSDRRRPSRDARHPGGRRSTEASQLESHGPMSPARAQNASSSRFRRQLVGQDRATPRTRPPHPGAPRSSPAPTPPSLVRNVAQCPIGNPTHRPRRSTRPPVASNVTPSRADAAKMVRQVVSPASSGPLRPDAHVRKLRLGKDLRDDPGRVRTCDPRFRSYMLAWMLSPRLSPYVAKRPRDREAVFAGAEYLIDVSRHTKPNVLCAFW
jgi:hypothetical protein